MDTKLKNSSLNVICSSLIYFGIAIVCIVVYLVLSLNVSGWDGVGYALLAALHFFEALIVLQIAIISAAMLFLRLFKSDRNIKYMLLSLGSIIVCIFGNVVVLLLLIESFEGLLMQLFLSAGCIVVSLLGQKPKKMGWSFFIVGVGIILMGVLLIFVSV